MLNPQVVAGASQLPLAYRMRGLDGSSPVPQQQVSAVQPLTTISPQMYSTIDYVNVNQQRARGPAMQQQWPPTAHQQQQFDARSLAAARLMQQQQQPARLNASKHLGLKLVCDIDQVFPVPEVSIYRLAKLDGSHPDKLAKLETRIERDVHTGLFHVQVTSILDDEELLTRRAPGQAHSTKDEPIYFECLIALTNLELSKYADNKRSIIYHPGEYFPPSRAKWL